MSQIKILCFKSSSISNGYLLEGINTNLLIEAGVNRKDILKKIRKDDFKKIKYGLLSHEHKDHSRAIYQYCNVKWFMSKGTKENIESIGINAKIIKSFKYYNLDE